MKDAAILAALDPRWSVLRVFFGGLLVLTAFLGATLLAVEWFTTDRPAAWLERVGEAAAAAAARTSPLPPGEPVPLAPGPAPSTLGQPSAVLASSPASSPAADRSSRRGGVRLDRRRAAR